jgi:hypothetical protein
MTPTIKIGYVKKEKLDRFPVSLDENPVWKGLENPMYWRVRGSSKRVDDFS